MYDLYQNKFLKHIPIENIKSKILSYVLKDDRLSYEIMGKHRDFIFITGYNQEEKELPVFDHPILIDSVMGKHYIVVDLRKYTKSSLKEKPALILPELSNLSYGKFGMMRAILTDMYLEDKSKLTIVQEPISILYAMIISTYIETLVTLTPKEKVVVEAVAYMYASSKFLENLNSDEKKNYFKAKFKSVKLSLPIINELYDEILSVNMNANKFEHLFENIGFVLGNKSKAIGMQSFINSISNLWYGPGAVETTLLSLDDLPTMISLYVSALSDTSLKKSRISIILDRYKRKIEVEKITKLQLNMKSYGL